MEPVIYNGIKNDMKQISAILTQALTQTKINLTKHKKMQLGIVCIKNSIKQIKENLNN